MLLQCISLENTFLYCFAECYLHCLCILISSSVNGSYTECLSFNLKKKIFHIVKLNHKTSSLLFKDFVHHTYLIQLSMDYINTCLICNCICYYKTYHDKINKIPFQKTYIHGIAYTCIYTFRGYYIFSYTQAFKHKMRDIFNGFFYKCNHTGMKVASIAGKLYNHVSARYVFSFSVLVATL